MIPTPHPSTLCRSQFRAWMALTAILFAPWSLSAQEKTALHYIADGFDFPVGKPDADGYYKARGYYPNGHLGEDWNGKGGGNTDRGDPIYAAAHGVVVYSDDFKAGWGNVVIIRHAYRDRTGQVKFIDGLYGHLDRRLVSLGDKVMRGDKIGTMGCGPHDMYYAHLHFEIRHDVRVGMNRSKYKRDFSVYHSPTHFIRENRRLRLENRRVPIPVDTFSKSNLNEMLTSRIGVPEIQPPDAGALERPRVPGVVETAIATQTDNKTEPVADRGGFWSRLLEYLGVGGGTTPATGEKPGPPAP
ncbi:MAG: M23 family metallopeptidase [Verrucomicrobiae bacterium]|nr:M23 family metallopeptidase [Verrucomicrobiae bacterium]MCP5540857.1 M23 family metallopeptidase [Akkermansiaceae bacterium]